MPPALPPGASLATYLVPLGIAAVVLVVRNSRPRRLKIERLWMTPAIYLVLMGSALAEAPPPLTPVSIAILVAAFALGAAIGWQRGRFTQIHIHPETHDLTSRASPIGIIFIFAILLLRYGARDFLATHPDFLHLPVIAIGEALLVMVVATLIAQRLEIWRRASQMPAEAKGAVGPRPPTSLVS
jgi:hypothetical protein